MSTWTCRPCLIALVAACLFVLTSEGASGGVYWSVHRLTVNKVADGNARISHGTIYWERFGGEQGNTEVFSYHISSGQTQRLTRNRFDDTLQAPGVWISSPIDPTSQSYVSPTDLAAIRQRNRANRQREVFHRYYQATHNRWYETSVQVAQNLSHGMVWLSKKIPRANAVVSFDDTFAFDVMWLNGRNRRITRLTDTPNATSVAFGGPWVAWTTTSRDEIKFQHMRSDVTRSIAVDRPTNLDVAGSYIKFETPGQVNLSTAFSVLSFGESRIKVYDALTDTLIDVGDDPSLGYHRDGKSVLSEQYVAYDRSFRSLDFVTATVNPLPEVTELRLFDIANLTDILITEGSGIGGIVMDDDTLVWQMLDTSASDWNDWDLEIFAYSFRSGTVRQVTDNNLDDRNPQVSGDTIVWTTTLPDGGTEIFYEMTGSYPVSPMFPVFDDLIGVGVTPLPFIPTGVVVATVPEPTGVMLLSIAGLATINRRRTRPNTP